MKYGSLIVSKTEHKTLQQIIHQVPHRVDTTYRRSLERLPEELKTARLVPNKEMPSDVVRLQSKVAIVDPDNKLHTFEIVTPGRSNIVENRLSILAPMGLALYGYAEGDVVKWQFPSGEQEILIVRVTQNSSITKEEAIS